MNGSHSSSASQKDSFFNRSMEGFANVVAAILTFFVAPPLYNVTIWPVQAFTRWQWGNGMEELTILVWAVLVGCFVFFGSRATVGAALLSAGFGLALRLLA